MRGPCPAGRPRAHRRRRACPGRAVRSSRHAPQTAVADADRYELTRAEGREDAASRASEAQVNRVGVLPAARRKHSRESREAGNRRVAAYDNGLDETRRVPDRARPEPLVGDERDVDIAVSAASPPMAIDRPVVARTCRSEAVRLSRIEAARRAPPPSGRRTSQTRCCVPPGSGTMTASGHPEATARFVPSPPCVTTHSAPARARAAAHAARVGGGAGPEGAKRTGVDRTGSSLGREHPERALDDPGRLVEVTDAHVRRRRPTPARIRAATFTRSWTSIVRASEVRRRTSCAAPECEISPTIGIRRSPLPARRRQPPRVHPHSPPTRSGVDRERWSHDKSPNLPGCDARVPCADP